MILSGLWLLMAAAAGPVANIPLNDDWAYGQVVQRLVEHGVLRCTGWVEPTLVAQALWGALFCLPFGFSFTALRVSTLVLGLVGVLATYGLFLEVRARPRVALLAALVVATNPVYFVLSCSFMTDVPFFAFAVLSVFLLLRGVRRGASHEIVLGTVASCLAILTRQVGLAIPLAFGIAYARGADTSRKARLAALLPGLAGLLALTGYYVWADLSRGVPALFHARTGRALSILSAGPVAFLHSGAHKAMVALVYVGLFLLPLLAVAFSQRCPSLDGRERRKATAIVGGLATAILGWMLWHGGLMPNWGNILRASGLGPLTLRDVYILNQPDWPRGPWSVWLAMSLAAAAGAALLLHSVGTALARSMSRREPDSAASGRRLAFLLAASAIFFAPLLVTDLFDRYFLLLVPLLGAAALESIGVRELSPGRSWAPALAVLMVVVAGLFSIGATHDYLSWNRARWEALNQLTDQGVSYRRIDGGFEFNGWYGYDGSYQPSAQRSWWWVYGDDYVVSFGPMKGYKVAARYPYERWVPFGKSEILVLRRAGPPPSPR